jgi:multisubunit Na+/H+ antiporter MnhC subunit
MKSGVIGHRISRRWWKFVLALSVTLVLTVVLVEFPAPAAPGVDPSKELVLVQAHQANLQFGSEIICPNGPWGFLISKFYFHGISRLKILWETVGKLGLAITFVLLGWRLSPLRQLLFYASVILAATIFAEATLLLCATLVSMIWVLGRESKPWQLALAIAWLSLLSQIKFNYCVLAVVAVVIAAIYFALQRNWKHALGIVAGYLGGFFLLWVAAGQSGANLPTYLYRGWQISSGYWDAVVVNEIPVAAWWTAIAIGLCVLAFAWSVNRRSGERLWIGFVLAYFSIAWFLSWKYGFTRADKPHASIFFLHGLAFALAAASCFKTTQWYSSLNLVPILSLLGLHLLDPQMLSQMPANLWWHLDNAPRDILSFRDRSEKLADGELRDHEEGSRAELERLVQKDTIDAITYEQSEVLRAGLNYHPRPVFQSYLTFSRPLAELNLRFYQGDRAPRFVFVRLDSIDSRLPAQDDSLLLEELPRRYSIAAEKADYLLLERKLKQPEERDQARDWTPMRRVRLGKEVMLPPDGNAAVELRAVFKPTLYGLMRGFFVQPALLKMILIDDRGQEYSRRLEPSMAETGFIVQPFLESHQALAALFGGRSPHLIRSFRFESNARHCWSTIKVQFCLLKELPLRTSPAGQGSQMPAKEGE